MIKCITYLLASFVMLTAPLSRAEGVQVALSMGSTGTARDIAVVQNIMAGLEGEAFDLQLTDAQGSLSRQLSDIRALIARKPDYLLVSAVRSIGLGAIIEEAKQADIPVILVDRFSTDVPEEDVLACIGIDWNWAGATCADILGQHFQNRHASILEVQGASGVSSTQEASKGFRAALRACEGLQLAGVLVGGGDRQSTSQVVQDFIEDKGFCFDAVFAHGDEQALGVINALLSASADWDIPIVCIGGGDDVQRAMTAGVLFACVRIDENLDDRIAEVIQRDMAGETSAQTSLGRGFIQYAAEGD